MIVVTGGAGFIGSNIVRGLNNLGIDNILVVDDLTDGSKHKNLNRLNFADFIDYREFLPEIGRFSVNTVFHQGACSDTTESNGRYVMEVNYDYTKAVLQHCMANKARFIYASSASVYGDGGNGFSEKPECEYPLNMYAFSKYQFDRYYRMHEKIYTSQVVGLRYFNVYGPQENHKGKMASVAYHMFNQIQDGQDMKLFEGSDNFKRDFIHVDDVVKVNLFFYENPEISGIYNCGTGRAEPFTAISRAMRQVFTSAEVREIPFPDTLKGKYQEFTQADLTKLRAAGYKEEFLTVGEGVKKYIEVLKNSGGYLI